MRDADAEGGVRLERPIHADDVLFIQSQDRASNAFVVLHLSDDAQDWFISVATPRQRPERL